MNAQMGRKRQPAAKTAPARVAAAPTITAVCPKCKAKTGHVVVAKVGVKPTRVECVTCKDTHAFKATMPARPAAATPVSPEQLWAAVMRSAGGVATPYSATENYRVGTRLSHASFGEGVVARLASATVCEVVFQARTVKLLMRPGASVPDAPSASTRPSAGLRRRFS